MNVLCVLQTHTQWSLITGIYQREHRTWSAKEVICSKAEIFLEGDPDTRAKPPDH